LFFIFGKDRSLSIARTLLINAYATLAARFSGNKARSGFATDHASQTELSKTKHMKAAELLNNYGVGNNTWDEMYIDNRVREQYGNVLDFSRN
jgi:hypothetical protein